MSYGSTALDPTNRISLRLDRLSLFAAGYVALVIFGQWVANTPGRHVSVYLASGLYFAVLLSSDRRYWLRWAATAFVTEAGVDIWLYGEAAVEALCGALGHTLGVVAGAQIVRAWCGRELRLNTLRDVLVLSFVAAIVSPALSIVVNGLLRAAAGQVFPERNWLIYWTSNAAGALVVAPLLLTLRQHAPGWRSVSSAKWLEAAALAVTLTTALHFIFSSRLPVVFLCLPVMLWAAVRFGMLGTTLAVAVFMAIAIRSSADGQGPYGVYLMGSTLVAQALLAFVSISAMCFAAIIEQYQLAQQALQRARDELEMRVAERTAALAQSEQQLRESNARFDIAQAAAKMIVLDWNVAADTLMFSDDPEWLRGPLPAGAKYPLFKDQVHVEDRAYFLTTRDTALITLQGQTLEFRVVRTDGVVLWVQSYQTVFPGPDGRGARMVAALQDISARKQIEASLRESEQRVRALLDGLPDRAWLKDAAGRYIATNRAHVEGYGHSTDKIIGKTIFEIRPPEVAERIAAEDRRVMASGVPMRFERRLNAQGNWAEITKVPLFGADKQFAGIVGVWRDISVRKEAEQQALLESEQRYRTLVNATSQAIWIMDAEGRLGSIIKSITGEHVGQVKGRNWLDFVHVDDRAAAARAMRAAVASKSAYEHEHRIMNRNGGWWDVLARAVPVVNADGTVREWIGTSMDVSGRKRAEQALRETNQTLRRISGRREETLEAERARIAHNLHDGAAQTLNVVRLKIAALAKHTSANALAAPLMEILQVIDQINQEIRSLEFELSPPVLRQLGLVPALRWLGEEMQRSYGLGVSVSDDGEDKPLDQARRAATFRAVRELLINVAKHARVNTAHVDAQRVEGSMIVTVSDMGAGFAAADVELMGATGLGLAGVRERIEFCGGGVKFDSAPGAGTVSTITMPLMADAL